MAKILLTIQADNRATESVKALNAEARVLAQTLSSIKVNKNLTAQINALTKHYTALTKAQAQIVASNNKQAISDEKLRQQQAKTATEAIKLATAHARLEKAQQKTSTTTEQLQKKFANLLSTIKSIKNAYPQGTFDKIEQSVRENLQAAKDGTKGVEDLGSAYNTLSRDLAVTKAETEKVTTAVVKSGDSIASLAKKFLLWQVTATLVMKPLRLIQDALSSINETLVKTEDTVIALQRVLPRGSATDSEISSRLYKIAADYGQTFENVSQIATNFARTGMSWADTIKATEAAVLALNVAELDATEASDGMIAILTQFGLKAEDLQLVVDKLNITADNAAVTTEKLLAALQRTGSAAKNANLSLDETLAIITALSEATGRSGENLGTALNSLIQYSSKASALDTFAALSDDSAKVVAEFRNGSKNILDVWQQVSKEIQNLKADQADLLDSYFNSADGEALKEALDGELQDIYTELGGVYDTANTFRKNYFIALLGNMDAVEQALGTLGEAAGYSQEENIKYLNTYTAQANALKATWESLVSNESAWAEFKKGFVGLGNAFLAIIQDVGGLSQAFIYLVSSTVLVVSTFKTLTGGLNPISKAIISLVQSTKSLTDRMKSLGGVSKTLKRAFTDWGQAIKSVKTYLKQNAEAQRTAKEAQEAMRSATLLNADASATVEQRINAENAVTLAKAAADYAATGSTEALNIALQQLSAVINMVMIALTVLVMVITAIVSAVDKSRQETERANEALRENSRTLNENVSALNEQNETLLENIQSLDVYIKKVEDMTASEEDRQEALSEIISISAELLESYGLENDALLTLTTSYAGLNSELETYLGLAKELAAKKAADALTEAQEASGAAQSAKNATRATIDLAGPVTNEAVRRGLIESGVTTGMSKQFGRTEGVGVYGAVALDFEATEENLAILEEWEKLINQRLDSDISNHSRWEAQLALSAVMGAKDKIKEALDLVDKSTQNELAAWARNELLNTELAEEFYGAQGSENENYEALKRLQDAIRNNTEYTEEQRDALNALVTKELSDYLGKYKAIVEENGNLYNDITKVTQAYDDLIKKLEELRDAEKESLELEERKQAVLEAQKALESAKTEATVRRYNQDTGQWEWQVDEKKVAEAEKNLEKARKDLETQSYDTIIDQLQNRTATNEGLNNLLDGLIDYLGEDFVKAIKAAILDNTGVDLDKPINNPTQNDEGSNPPSPSPTPGKGGNAGGGSVTTKSYDSGGIANGMGYMPKATSRPETVLNPEITAQILSPVSNERFHQFTKDLGLMFETQRDFIPQPIIERVGGNTDNRVDNSGQIIFGGGLTVAADSRSASIDDVLAIGGIIHK